MPDYEKIMPDVFEGTKPFREGTKKQELRIQKCQECGKFYFYPRPFCPHCFSDNVEWTKVSGKGRIYSYTVSYRPSSPAFRDDVPYNISIVELDEGARMLTNVVECSNEDLKIDMPVEVVFEEISPEITLPKFRPTRS